MESDQKPTSISPIETEDFYFAANNLVTLFSNTVLITNNSGSFLQIRFHYSQGNRIRSKQINEAMTILFLA